MKLTTKGRYAVSAMLDIAIYSKGAAVSLSEISDRQGISVAYLEQLASKLRAKGLLTSVRGAKGGYLIAKDLNLVTISEIISAIEESTDTRKCLGMRNCKNGKECLTHNLWEDLNKVINNFLSEITLEKLVSKNIGCKNINNSLNTSLKIVAVAE